MTDPHEQRQARLLSLVDADGVVAIKRVCEVCVEVTGASGSGIMFMAGDVARGSLYSTDATSATIEELQFSLGEGPCVDAYHEDRPVSEPDLTDPAATRWPAFTEGAIEAGARSVFCFPLHVGAVRLGALDLYRTTTGPLSEDQHADALAMADIATRAVLVLQAEAPPGQLAPTLEAGADLRLGVHQASGMVAAQLGVTVGQALVCLRANAFGSGHSLERVAADVIARTLRFDGPLGAARTVG
jgi:hypothetical protein